MSNMIRKAGVFEILNHWALAVSFFILAISGFGFIFHLEQVNSLFGGIHQMRDIHNWAGVIFSVSLFFTIFSYLPVSLVFTGEDLIWLLKAGGYFSRGATVPPQDKLNAAQKGFYLFLLLTGGAISATGLIIWLRPEMSNMQKWILISHLLHNISFVLMLIAIPSHIFLGTLTNPGTFRVMVYGTVPVDWARKRHAKWVKKMGF